jgi:hypothetical protein
MNGIRHGKMIISVRMREHQLIPYREPPPVNSKPEGISLQQKTYTMSDDTQLFQPPASYPEAPRNMYYQVPATRSAPEQPAPVFPWESHAPKPTRVFPVEQPPPEVTEPEPMPSQTTDDTLNYSLSTSSPPPPSGPSYTRVPYEPSSESWQNYTRSNAWDEDPEIQRYIETVQQARKARTQVVSSPGSSHSNTSATSHNRDRDSVSSPPSTSTSRKPSTIITDFPTEMERPSLPVTPAPIRRGSHGGGGDASGVHGLPVAEGVPSQEEWVGVTVDAFSSLLNATYLLWRFTESPGETRGAASSAVGGFGASGATL